MQDDEIKSCCVQNQNKYIYQIIHSSKSYAVWIDSRRSGLWEDALSSVHPLLLLLYYSPLLFYPMIPRPLLCIPRCLRLPPFPSSTSSQTPRFSHPSPVISLPPLRHPSLMSFSPKTLILYSRPRSPFLRRFRFSSALSSSSSSSSAWRCLKLHPKATWSTPFPSLRHCHAKFFDPCRARNFEGSPPRFSKEFITLTES